LNGFRRWLIHIYRNGFNIKVRVGENDAITLNYTERIDLVLQGLQKSFWLSRKLSGDKRIKLNDDLY